MHTSELDMAESIDPADIGTFIDNAACAIHSTFHTVLEASPGAVILGLDMLLNIPFVADWKQIGDYKQSQTSQWQTRKQINMSTSIIKFVTKYWQKGWYPPQSRVHTEKQPWTSIYSSYKWSYQDSKRNQIGKN